MSNTMERLRAALADRYSVEAMLGAGGMATVYRATDLRHKREVAIKVLHADVAAAVGTERFTREIEIVAGLHHPHILPLYDSGQSDGFSYYVMPLCEGESLRERLERQKRLPAQDAVRIAREVADALEYAHRRGVVHRDIKPDNVMIEGGHALVTDFGIARVIDSDAAQPRLTATGLSVGTPLYMSPEQLAGERYVDARSDVYALSCVLYEMIAGEPPLAGPTAHAIAARRLSELPKLRGAAGGVSRTLEQAVLKGLAPVPDDRWASAAQFSSALDVAIPRTGRIQPWMRRNWKRAGMLGAAAIVVVATILLGTRAQFARAPAASQPQRIAVLPFENLGPSDQAYFADGMSDEVRSRLTEIPGITVIGRASSVPYRGTTETPRAIGRELSVGWLLTGTVRWEKRPDGTSIVHVSPELIRIRDAAAEWSKAIDAPLTDVFRVQASIAAQVAQALDVVLTSADQQRLSQRPTANLEAYDAWLRGEELSDRLGSVDPETMRRAAGLYERAVQLDSTFALAWARLAAALALHHTYNPTDSTEVQRANAASRHALALSPDLPAAHVAAGMVLTLVGGDYAGALVEFDAARRLLPAGPDADLLSSIGLTEQFLDRWEQSAADLRDAQRLDPHSIPTYIRLTRALLYLRRYDEGQRVLDSALALAPYNQVLLNNAEQFELARGHLDSAQLVIRNAPPSVERDQFLALTVSAWDLYWMLDDEQQRQVLALAPRAFDGDRFVWALGQAEVRAMRGDSARSRAYADTARAVMESRFGGVPTPMNDLTFHAIALAFAGRLADATREEQAADALYSSATNLWTRDQDELALARLDVIRGDHARALTRLEQLLSVPFFVSSAWLRIDPEFAPLRNEPRFRRLTAG